ncbi:MAG: helix-turn-helix domain-containing protein [Candidatus Cyclobacteriaceae bacterium M2_1C_046]
MKYYIKNMVCQRCITAVSDLLEKEGYSIKNIKLGEAEIEQDLSKNELSELDEKLVKLGFELIDDKKSQLIERIKNIIIEQVHHKKGSVDQNWSDILTSALPYDYKYLSRLFSSVEGITIEHFIIKQKIEKAKEQIIYDQLSLSEIAYFLGYSSVPHFSSQFKKITGMTPTEFKKLQNPSRRPLDEV